MLKVILKLSLYLIEKIYKYICILFLETLKYLKTNCLDSEIEKIEANREKELSRLTVEDKDVLVEVK